MSPLMSGWDTGSTAPDLNARKGRYGAAYVSDVCAHFGVPVSENKPDEDWNAIDMSIAFECSDIRIQVKCTASSFTARDPHLLIPVEDAWVEKWSRNKLPAYMIAVHVPDDPSTWVDYDSDDLTSHFTAAYWARIDQLVPGQCRSVQLPRANRFTPQTLREWNAYLDGSFEVVTR